MDNRTERLADGVWRVEVGWYRNAYLLADDGHGDAAGLTLVDPGRAGDAPRLVRSIRMLGFDPRAVAEVLCTHWHAGHAGAAAPFARSSAAPRVAIGADDLDVLRGVTDPTTASSGAARAATRAGLVRVPAAVPEATALHNGDVRATCGGLEVLATGAHTPGHCAFWLGSRGVLLAGDLVANVLRLGLPPRQLDADPAARAAALTALAALDPGTLAVGHGPHVITRVAERLSALAARLERRSRPGGRA